MPGQLEPKAESGIVQGLSGRCPGSLKGGKAPAAPGWVRGFRGSTLVLGRGAGCEVCRQAGPLREVGVHTRGKRRKQLEEEEPERGRGQRAPAPAGVGVRPVSWSVGESRLLGFTCTPRGCLPAPGLELPKQSLSCPATTGLRIPKKLAPLRIAGPFFDRRKRWLGEGCRQGGRQESRGLLLYSERPLPWEAGRPAAG